ncbi:MAG: AAA family ATPase [Schleiferiaceae bacterium]|nr:AAA family ATPase [Schleiferiaceae bacterium]
MEYTFSRLQNAFHHQLQHTPTQMVRSAMAQINWKPRLVGIKGARGVGKTTLVLQYIKLHLNDRLSETLYVSLDALWFAEHSLLDLAELFIQKGGQYLFLDEVHKYPNWSQELKNCYDQFPQLKIVFTGSSLLEILNARADLSRRAVMHELPGLSFREYLSLENDLPLPSYPLADILTRHLDIVPAILEQVPPLRHFSAYLREGYYPFYREDDEAFSQKLQEMIQLALDLELPLLRKVETAYLPRIKQLLYIIAQGVPFVPNTTKLSHKIHIERSTLLRYFHYLEEINLTHNLFKSARGISQLQKPQKIYLNNPNLMYALADRDVNRGSLRETFFISQLAPYYHLQYPPSGDFWVEDRYLIEVGGRDKTARQLKSAAQGFIAADQLEYGHGQKVPLWLFGFLY